MRIDKFWSARDGSISVYLSLILSLVLFFNYVLYELLHLEIVKREFSVALHGSSRSVLSNFDSKLFSYGLYATDTSQGKHKEITDYILRNQLDFSRYSTKLYSTKFKFENTLADQNEIEKQMIAEMRLSTPQNFAMEFIKPLKSLDALSHKNNPTALLDNSLKLHPLIEKRKLILIAIQRMLREIRINWYSKQTQMEQNIQSIVQKIEQLTSLERLITNIPGIGIYSDHFIIDIPFIHDMKSKLNHLMVNKFAKVDTVLNELDLQLQNYIDRSRVQKKEQSLLDTFKSITSKQFLSHNSVCPGSGKYYKQLMKSYSEREDESPDDNDETKKLSIWSQIKKYRELYNSTLKQLTSMANANIGTVMNRMLVDEYVLRKFNYRTYLVGSNITLSSPESHLLFNQEAEFIVGGMFSCDKNLWLIATKLFTIRFTLRVIEFLINPNLQGASLTSPFTFILSSLIYGISNGLSDVSKLINNQQISFINIKGIEQLKLGYRHYLQMMLWFVNQSKKISRIQSLLELNTNKKMKNLATSVQLYGHTKYQFRAFKKFTVPLKFESEFRYK
jgi:hypothetical protein